MRTLSGNTITLDAESSDTIATIKSKIFKKEGTPAQHQRLAFASKQLQDSRSLQDYGIGRDCTLHLSGRLLGGRRLYHCTSRECADSIQRHGFRCGSQGLAGGGIYFAESVADASRKAQSHGVVLECEVNLGRVMDVGSNGDNSLSLSSVRGRGYDSVRIPRSGTEYCVYEPFRINIVGEHKDLPQNKITKFLKPLVFGVGYKLYKLHVNFRQLQNVRQTIWTPEMEYSL